MQQVLIPLPKRHQGNAVALGPQGEALAVEALRAQRRRELEPLEDRPAVQGDVDLGVAAAVPKRALLGHPFEFIEREIEDVVAEGVETPGQEAFLVERGCDEYQGELLSQPVPASEFLSKVLGAPG